MFGVNDNAYYKSKSGINEAYRTRWRTCSPKWHAPSSRCHTVGIQVRVLYNQKEARLNK